MCLRNMGFFLQTTELYNPEHRALHRRLRDNINVLQRRLSVCPFVRMYQLEGHRRHIRGILYGWRFGVVLGEEVVQISWGVAGLGFVSEQRQNFFSPQRRDPNLLFTAGTGGGSVPIGYSGRSVYLTTSLCLAPRLRMRGAVSPLTNTSSWRGA
jgi:hypothetical protein